MYIQTQSTVSRQSYQSAFLLTLPIVLNEHQGHFAIPACCQDDCTQIVLQCCSVSSNAEAGLHCCTISSLARLHITQCMHQVVTLYWALQVESTWLDEAQIEGSNSEGDELADNQTHACCNSKPCQHNSGAEHAEGSPAKKRKVEPPLVSDDIPKGQKSSCTHGKAPFATQDSNAQNAVTDDEGVDEAYIMAYLDRHVCDQEFSIGSDNNAMICGGTMAPCGVNSDEYECNMCGYTRSEAERIAKLERMYLEVTADVP